MSGSPWDPVLHEELDTDEPGSTADPQHAGGDKKTDKGNGKSSEKASQSAAVGLTLALPQDMIDAIWGAADQLKRTAMAMEENSNLQRRLINLLTGGKDDDKKGSAGAG